MEYPYLYNRLEIVAEAYFKTYICEVLEVIHAHIYIDSRLDADMVVQEKAVAHLWCQIDIVEVCRNMLVLEHTAEKETILLQVVTGTCTKAYVAFAILMCPA